MTWCEPREPGSAEDRPGDSPSDPCANPIAALFTLCSTAAKALAGAASSVTILAVK